MASVDDVSVDVSIVVGSAEMAVADVLKLGRGAFIPLGRALNDPLQVQGNGRPFAAARVRLQGERVAAELVS